MNKDYEPNNSKSELVRPDRSSAIYSFKKNEEKPLIKPDQKEKPKEPPKKAWKRRKKSQICDFFWN